jgi:exosome complex component CSL4
MVKSKENITVPGAEIATEEQYAGGKNTFSQNGAIKSLVLGKVVFDENRKEVEVIGKMVQTITIGDIVYGKVMNVKDSMIMVELKSAEGDKKITATAAMIPVRNISTEYVSDPKSAYRIGDLVKAKVVNNTPLGIDLATNEKGLGVIKAYCANCRHEMSPSNGKLYCFSCGSVEDRKWFENEQKPREFNPDRGMGGGRGFGGGFGGQRSFGNRGFGGRGRDNRHGGFSRGPRRDNRSSFGSREGSDGKFNKRF